jgi:acyl carrier protein
MTNTIAETQLEPAEVLSWLTLKFADWLEVTPDELDPQQPISSYGLDSISAVTLSVQLEEELSVELDTAVLWDRPTLESLAEHLSEKLNAADVTRLPDARAQDLVHDLFEKTTAEQSTQRLHRE